MIPTPVVGDDVILFCIRPDQYMNHVEQVGRIQHIRRIGFLDHRYRQRGANFLDLGQQPFGFSDAVERRLVVGHPV